MTCQETTSVGLSPGDLNSLLTLPGAQTGVTPSRSPGWGDAILWPGRWRGPRLWLTESQLLQGTQARLRSADRALEAHICVSPARLLGSLGCSLTRAGGAGAEGRACSESLGAQMGACPAVCLCAGGTARGLWLGGPGAGHRPLQYPQPG